MKILILEDEKALCDSMVAYLQQESSVCDYARDYSEAILQVSREEYDCVIIDITLPSGNGLNLINTLKAQGSKAAIIIVTARNSLGDKIYGLDLGADDYLTKPFHLAELNARVNSVLRRKISAFESEIIFEDFWISPSFRKVTCKGTDLLLTRKEYELLVYFIVNKFRVLSRESISEHLWGDLTVDMDTFDIIYTHVKNLRKKIHQASGENYIQSVYGIGYSFRKSAPE